ncbi:MAG: SPFH domain-containing protein [Bdellovibrionota bacterium]|nr:SPFH domain-containing protein [Pseudomonadota bacterium]MDY6090820.1 SPFH domain-containing protein [Bdellovibrionota bacterium]
MSLSFFKSFKPFLIFISFIVIIVVTLSYVFGVVVYPGEVALRQINFGPKQGVQKKILDAGLVWNIPFYSKIYKVPSVIQTLYLTNNDKESKTTEGVLEVQTVDGSSIFADIYVLYQFINESENISKEQGAYNLLTQIGVSGDLWMQRIKTATINELKKSLGSLSTSEFYNPYKREKAVLEAQYKINDRLKKFGISVAGLLLGRYTYKEMRIDNAIFEKNIQDQEERLNTARKKLGEAQAKTTELEAKWDAKIKTLLVEAENDAKVIMSKADLYEGEKKAQGDLLVSKAIAESQKLKADALKQSGADMYVTKELAPMVKSLKGGVVNGVDPYNLKTWMSKFGFNANGSVNRGE